MAPVTFVGLATCGIWWVRRMAGWGVWVCGICASAAVPATPGSGGTIRAARAHLHRVLGLDVRYAVTPHLSAYGTVNPDFATIEADQELVNLTRFEVSLTEKRQFFLEGGELFNQRIRTFYSRRIADMEGGGKLLGKQGPWAMHVLATRADPLAAGSSAGYAVARVQRDVAARSNVGRPAIQPDAGRAEPGLGRRRRQPVLHGELGPDRPVRPQLRAVLPRGRRVLRPPFLRFRDRPLPRRLHAPGRPPGRQRQRGRIHRRRRPAGGGRGPQQDLVAARRTSRTHPVRLRLRRLLGTDRDPPELAGGRVPGRRFPQPLDRDGAAHRGVQALRAGLPQSADRGGDRLQHEVLSVLPRRGVDRPQLRRGLRARQPRRPVQAHRPDLDRVRAPAADARSGSGRRRHLDSRGARQPFLHARPVPARFPADQLGHRPPQRAGGVRLPLPSAVRDGPGRLPARHGASSASARTRATRCSSRSRPYSDWRTP